jgi:hypothetical protein
VGVSCSSSTACTSVGSFLESGNEKALAERWNGTAWSTQTTYSPPPLTSAKLKGVSCPSSTLCVAVARNFAKSNSFIETWNGSAWSLVKTATEETSFVGEMKKISCPSTTYCMVVGANSSGALQSWKYYYLSGFGWLVETKTPSTPTGATSPALKDVSCSAESACTAVGSYKTESGEWKALVERWNGSAWSTQSAPNPSEGNAGEAMLGVSCPSSTFCTAVGKANSKPFAETWNGSAWSLGSASNPSGATSAVLEGVSCSSSTFCMATGSFHESGGLEKTLAERWNGSAWSVLSSPNPGEAEFGFGLLILNAVSCPSSTSCNAVGSYLSKSLETKTLAEIWNGTAWSLQSSPNPTGSTSNPLVGVSCSSSTACTSVGSFLESGNEKALAERYE